MATQAQGRGEGRVLHQRMGLKGLGVKHAAQCGRGMVKKGLPDLHQSVALFAR